MEMTVLGYSPAFPNAGRASSGYLVREASTQVLVDCGHGIASKLQTIMDPRALSAIVVSHMHADHFMDLIPLRYWYMFVGRIRTKLPLHLPPGGLGALAALESALDLSSDFFETGFELREYRPDEPLTLGDVRVRFAPTVHYIDAYAMRFSSEKDARRQLLYSSDTGWADSVLALGRDASLGLVEATFITYEGQESHPGHLTAELAGRLARMAGMERLILTHYWEPFGDELRLQASESFGGEVGLAREGETCQV